MTNQFDQLFERKAQPPTPEDKKALIAMIKKMPKRDHLDLFNLYIKSLEIMSLTNDGLFFDLNDVPDKVFWEMYEFAKDAVDAVKTVAKLDTLPHEVTRVSSYIGDEKCVRSRPFSDRKYYL